MEHKVRILIWEDFSETEAWRSTAYKNITQYDRQFASPQKHADWKDLVASMVSIPMLAALIYSAITNPR